MKKRDRMMVAKGWIVVRRDGASLTRFAGDWGLGERSSAEEYRCQSNTPKRERVLPCEIRWKLPSEARRKR
mgnify:CR=1 FL=1